jgi:hypothetical protein
MVRIYDALIERMSVAEAVPKGWAGLIEDEDDSDRTMTGGAQRRIGSLGLSSTARDLLSSTGEP